jgi:hypothetical protein
MQEISWKKPTHLQNEATSPFLKRKPRSADQQSKKTTGNLPELSNYEETTATTVEEIRALGKAGWIKYGEAVLNGTQIHFYRKPKRFGGLKNMG